jgi:hypothetical protein
MKNPSLPWRQHEPALRLTISCGRCGFPNELRLDHAENLQAVACSFCGESLGRVGKLKQRNEADYSQRRDIVGRTRARTLW